MGLKKCTICIVTVSLMAATVMGPALLVSLQGDINGDGRVDVLDAQLLVAQVVKDARAAAMAQSDANRDGTVNVLDLQYTLARVNGAPPENAPEPANSKSQKGAPVRTNSWAFLCVLAVATAALGTQRPPKVRRSFWLPRVQPSTTQRYLLTLTPHAPPSIS